ncbi:MAG: O-methyltransferase [Firmicutes bacterium]|jgi:predicted O-methyltransferase YrrM|nr:O-methyltransferase [Bacillota bacterium]MCL5971163.1 O-methyltransferase [Bacillota bacterium]
MNGEEYATQLFVHEDAILAGVRRDIIDRGMPAIFVPPHIGHLLSLLVKLNNSHDALEIGALGGYSGIWLARSLPSDGHLTSLELNPEYARVAQHNLERAGLGPKVHYEIGPALQSLEKLLQAGHRYDFFLIDADKENYPAYLAFAIEMARPGAIIAGDNALLHGRVVDFDDLSPSAVAMRQFNEQMATHPRLTAMMITMGDGLSIARVNY